VLRSSSNGLLGCAPSERQRSSELFSSDDGGSQSGDRVSTKQEHEMGMGDHGGNERTRGIEWGRTDADKGCAFITPQQQKYIRIFQFCVCF